MKCVILLIDDIVGGESVGAGLVLDIGSRLGVR